VPRLLVGGVCSAALVAGLAQPLTPASAATRPGAATPQHGGTLNFLTASLQSNLAPTQTGPAEEDASVTGGAIYGYLGYLNDKTGAVELQFLKSITPAKGNKTWTLVLHPGIKFSDGTPLDASAIAYTIQQQSNPNSGDSNFATEKTWKTQVVNATTLKITLPTGDAQFPAEMTQDFPYIGSPTAWKKEGANFATKPVGAGPYMLQSWTQNDQLTEVPNPYYKNFAPGEPYISKLVFTLANQQSRSQYISGMDSHQYQMGWLEGTKEFNEIRQSGYTVQGLTSSGGEFLLFNAAKAPFNNVLARRAVSDALNHQELASIWSPGTAPFTNFYSPSSPYYNKANNFGGQNPAEAAKLFAQLHKEGVNLNMDFVTVTGFANTAAYLQSTLDKYPGVHVTASLDNINSYIQSARAGDFSIFAFGVNFVNPWPSVFNAFAKTGSGNFGKWNDPATQKAVSIISQTRNPATLKKEYNIIANRVATQDPFFASQGSQLGLAWAKNVHNVQSVEFGVTPLMGQAWMSNS